MQTILVHNLSISEKLLNQWVNNNEESKFIVWRSFHSILSVLNYYCLQRRGSDSPSPGRYHFEYLNLFSYLMNKKHK